MVASKGRSRKSRFVLPPHAVRPQEFEKVDAANRRAKKVLEFIRKRGVSKLDKDAIERLSSDSVKQHKRVSRVLRNRRFPEKSLDGGFELVNSGREAALYRLNGVKGRVFKFWRQDWILSNYKLLSNGQPAHKRAAKRAARRFHSLSHLHLDMVEKKNVPHHGLPINEFRKVTFVLSGMTEDVLNAARALGIPAPRVARMVLHPTKELYIVEMSDLSKKGADIISANELLNPNVAKKVKNASELIRLMGEDQRKLALNGIIEDSSNLHPPLSPWLIRVNTRTGIGERFLWDTTNLSYK